MGVGICSLLTSLFVELYLHLLPFINGKKIFILFYGKSITSSRRNVHFNHPLVHLRNYHANASLITSLECHFRLLLSLLCLWKHIFINNTVVYIF